MMMHEARYYHKLEKRAVQCCLCPNNCVIGNGCVSTCLSRRNTDGVLYAINYGQTTTLNPDPIEKKPLYHYYPGSRILSLGPNSCNLHCTFCQNHNISQNLSSTTGMTPEMLLSILVREKQNQVAITYTEPFTWYEYILDFAKLTTLNNIRIVLITNGYINPEPLEELLPYIDAMNIDLKGMSEEFYSKVCQGKLYPVLETVKMAHTKSHIEITNLLIPGLNDDKQMIASLTDFIASINENIPLHFSRYFPNYKCDIPTTPAMTLKLAYEIAKTKLKNVYTGNIEATLSSNTYCSECNATLIERNNYQIRIQNLEANHCTVCGTKVYGKY